jgi:hypothetical protein
MTLVHGLIDKMSLDASFCHRQAGLMTSQTLSPDVTSTPARRWTASPAWLRTALRARRAPDGRAVAERGARRAAARRIAAYPATRGVSTVVLPSAGRQGR